MAALPRNAMNLRRLMQNCPSRTKPTRGQSCASQQKFAADGRDGSNATEPFGDRSDLCPLLSQERQFEAWVWKVAKGYKQTLKRRKSLPAKVCNDWAGAGYCFEDLHAHPGSRHYSASREVAISLAFPVQWKLMHYRRPR